MYNDNNTINSIVPAQYPRVIFRIKGENKPRQFDLKDSKLSLEQQNKICNTFVDTRCKPFMQSHDCGLTWKVLFNEVDHFYFDHPLVVK